MMSDNSLLKSSGQAWKPYTSFALSLLGLILLLLPISSPDRYGDRASILLIVGGLGLAVGSFVWASLSIRCPACKAKLFWIAVSGHSPTDWLTWLLRRVDCPVCGHVVTDKGVG